MDPDTHPLECQGMKKRLSVPELLERWRSRQLDDYQKGGLKFSVQFIFPVNNPEYNVGMERRRRVFKFFVPINHPNAHNMGFQELLEAGQLHDLSTESTDLNKKTSEGTEESK